MTSCIFILSNPVKNSDCLTFYISGIGDGLDVGLGESERESAAVAEQTDSQHVCFCFVLFCCRLLILGLYVVLCTCFFGFCVVFFDSHPKYHQMVIVFLLKGIIGFVNQHYHYYWQVEYILVILMEQVIL